MLSKKACIFESIMKFKKRKIAYWILQILGWILYGTLLFLAAYKNSNNEIKSSVVLSLIFSVILGILFSHLLRNLYFKKNYFNLNPILLVINIIVFSGLFATIYTLINKVLVSLIYWSFENWDFLSLILNTLSIFMVFITWSTFYFTVMLYEESRKNEIKNLILKKSQVELELQNLRSQLNPHFLFNSLNAIRALVEGDPKKAKLAINQLSNLLRSTLKLNSEKMVSIIKEMELVDTYLQLEKIRFEERLNYTKSIDDNCLFVEIPSFTIQTFVENAIKHGISKLVNGGEINVLIYQKYNRCFISVINSGNLGKEVDLGIGLTNLRKRLSLQYDFDYSFIISEDDNKVKVMIEIPLNFKV